MRVTQKISAQNNPLISRCVLFFNVFFIQKSIALKGISNLKFVPRKKRGGKKKEKIYNP